MGLNMYLRGRKASFARERPKEDGFEVVARELDLGCWRKHPNLHGYIVQEFAGGVDRCQRIDLEREDLAKIIDYLESGGELPHTTGFFFGESDNSDEERQRDLAIFRAALAWVKAGNDSTAPEWREVFYQASW